MEEQGVIGFSISHQPLHSAQDVLFCRLTHGILLVIRKDYHILALAVELGGEVGSHVADIVDAAA